MSGSTLSSGTPVPTCTFGATSTELTRPRNTAVTVCLHLHALEHDERIADRHLAPPVTRATDTITAGAGARTTPPSSRGDRCVMPSTSTVWIGPRTADTTR